VPLFGGETGSPSNNVRELRPTSLLSGILIFPTIHHRHRQDRQQSDSIGRTVLDDRLYKRFTYAIGLLSVCLFCNVGVLWPNDWMD